MGNYLNLKSPDHSIRITKRCDGVDLAVSLQTITPRWTTIGRPTTPVEPNMGYNTTLHIFEYWNGTEWTPFGSGDIVVSDYDHTEYSTEYS